MILSKICVPSISLSTLDISNNIGNHFLGSPANNAINASHERDRDHRDKDVRDLKLAKRETREGYQMNANSFGGERRSSSVSSRHSR